jgi:hypothetical protein
LRVQFRPNLLGPISYFAHQLTRPFFKFSNDPLRDLLKRNLALAFAFRRFFIKRSKLLRDSTALFFERDHNGVPRKWVQRIRRAMETLVPQFNTWRMVQEYTQKYYAPR